MTSAIYDRQERLALKIPASIAIVGLGGIGTWVALFAAMSGVPRLVLFDDDTLDVTNLNRLPYTSEQIGQPKTEIAANLIASLRPECIVEQNRRATELNVIMSDVQFLLDCTDSLATQLMLYKACLTTEGKVIYERAGYDGTGFTVADSVPEWTTEETPTVGYRHDPSWVCPSALAASLAVAKMLDTVTHKYATIISMDISEIGKGVIKL